MDHIYSASFVAVFIFSCFPFIKARPAAAATAAENFVLENWKIFPISARARTPWYLTRFHVWENIRERGSLTSFSLPYDSDFSHRRKYFQRFLPCRRGKLDGARTQERFRSPTRWQRVVNFPSDTKLHRSARGSLILNNAAKRDVRNTRDTRTSQMNGKRDKTGLKGSKIHDDRVTESRGRDAIKISSRSSRAFWSALTLQSHLLLGLQNSFNGKRKSNACPWRTTAKANR